jgi:hypothetical protein
MISPARRFHRFKWKTVEGRSGGQHLRFSGITQNEPLPESRNSGDYAGTQIQFSL